MEHVTRNRLVEVELVQRKAMTRSSSQTGDLHMLPRRWVSRPLDLQSEWFLPESLASGVDS